MNFEKFLTRTDEGFIEDVVGKGAIQILNMLDPITARASSLREILVKVYSPIDLLTRKETRNELFDILKEDEVKVLQAFLGKPVSGSYEDLKLLRFKDAELRKLYDFFEVPFESEEVKELMTISSASPQYGLFSHQRKAVRQVIEKLYDEPKRVMLHMPTGAGKTRTAMNVICDHLRSSEPRLVIWLAHTEELCEQAATEFQKAWSLLGNRELPLVRYWGQSNYQIDQLRDGLIVAGVSKLFNLLKTSATAISTLARYSSLIVMDEAHMAIAPSFKNNLNVLTTFGASLLGLSATPGRTWNNRQADEDLAHYFAKQKVTLMVEGYNNPVDYLVAEGYLAKVKSEPLMYSSGIRPTDQDLNYLQQYFQLPEKYLKALSEDVQRNILIIKKIEDLIRRHKRIIVFGLNIQHSDTLAVILQARKHEAYSITSKTDPLTRKSLIARFKEDNDSPMVLCNYGILTTGFDAPKTSCALIARPTDSLVLYSQMVGRAIRGPKAGGNSNAEIVTVVDTCLPGFDKVATAFFNWEDVW